MQLRWPELVAGANAVSLTTAQRNFAKFGASEERFAGDVRPALPDEPRDAEWRPIRATDPFEGPADSAPWPADRTKLYYWRSTFWRAS